MVRVPLPRPVNSTSATLQRAENVGCVEFTTCGTGQASQGNMPSGMGRSPVRLLVAHHAYALPSSGSNERGTGCDSHGVGITPRAGGLDG